MPALSQAWYTKLHWQVLAGMIAGILLGLVGDDTWIPYYRWTGDIFLKSLKMVVVPLIVSSLIVGVARLGHPREVGRLGGKTLLYYIVTSALAIVSGMVFVNLFQPGVGLDITGLEAAPETSQSARSLTDVLYSLVPVNPIGAAANFGMSKAGSAGLVGLIVFCVLFGLGTASLPDSKRDHIVGFFDAVFEVMMKITGVIIRLAPIGVASLIAVVLASTGADVIVPLLGYMGTVLGALGVHFFLTIPLLLYLFGRRNPYQYMKAVGLALATAFTTASSNATLPVSMTSAETRGGVDKKVSGFVLPLGATINMDGTALYEGVAALFVAQVYGRQLGLDDQLLLFVIALLASIGAAGIPHASLVMMTVVFEALGLPLEAIGMLLGVDRVLTMCRTATNVWSDLAGAAIIDRLTVRPTPSAKSGPP
jgi:proton glutamate symport protein